MDATRVPYTCPNIDRSVNAIDDIIYYHKNAIHELEMLKDNLEKVRTENQDLRSVALESIEKANQLELNSQ